MLLDVVLLVVAALTLIAAIGAWIHARPSSPFALTRATGDVFGLERAGYWPAEVIGVVVPEEGALGLAAMWDLQGPFSLKRGEVIYLTLGDLEPPREVLVEWRLKGRKGTRYWSAHVL